KKKKKKKKKKKGIVRYLEKMINRIKREEKKTIQKLSPIQILQQLHESAIKGNQLSNNYNELAGLYQQACLSLETARKQIHSLKKRLQDGPAMSAEQQKQNRGEVAVIAEEVEVEVEVDEEEAVAMEMDENDNGDGQEAEKKMRMKKKKQEKGEEQERKNTRKAGNGNRGLTCDVSN
ncbi:hypothetical protein RFI_21408, partial [Reticulomyxa filosa]